MQDGARILEEQEEEEQQQQEYSSIRGCDCKVLFKSIIIVWSVIQFNTLATNNVYIRIRQPPSPAQNYVYIRFGETAKS